MIGLFWRGTTIPDQTGFIIQLETETNQADVTGSIGQYAYSNEPSHHITYLYTLAGRPERTRTDPRNL